MSYVGASHQAPQTREVVGHYLARLKQCLCKGFGYQADSKQPVDALNSM